MRCVLYCIVLSLTSSNLLAENEPEQKESSQGQVERLEVLGDRVNLMGEAITATQGRVEQTEIERKPLSRVGEIVEFVPGFIATQHSGSGKANQYFGRGFNLDHGTDFSMVVDGMPVNFRSHGHGQGYADINFLIPEVLKSIEYRKGPYFADAGDFSSAGIVQFETADRVDQGSFLAAAGSYGFVRAVLLDSIDLSEETSLLYAVESQRYDGPWTGLDEDVRKTNGMAKFSYAWGENTLSTTLMAYDNTWNSADQIPERLVKSGQIERFGVVDPALGGETHRYSLSARWQRKLEDGALNASVYAIDYDFDLYSNFTYFLNSQDNGDQLKQKDTRRIYGFSGDWQKDFSLFGRSIEQTIGVQGQWDEDIETGLYGTVDRQVWETRKNHSSDIKSLAVFSSTKIPWTSAWRSNIGYRVDNYQYSVTNLSNQQKGTKETTFGSAKASLSYRPIYELEFYLAGGQGFHTNDAKGVVGSQIDDEIENDADLVVRTLGYDFGANFLPFEELNLSVGFWQLSSDSELLFVGDEGTTEANRGSLRKGVELASYYRPTLQWTFDLELSLASARYREDPDDEGRYVEGYVPVVLSSGFHGEYSSGWFHDLRLRHFGKRPLTADNTVKSSATSLVNVGAGYRWQELELGLTIFNAFDREDSDIEYFYESQILTEANGEEDIHFHPVEPRAFRLHARYAF